MCHSNMPRLNDFGQRYRMNGYQLPGLENMEKTVLESPAPVALRTSAGYTGTMFNDAERRPAANESDFRMNGLDLLSAGQLGRNIGYFMVYVPQIAQARGVAGQEGSLEMASVVFSNLARTWLNVRVGRFEPAYVPFSVKRQLSVSPYEIYDAAFPEGPAFSGTQSGVEISGYGPSRFQYAAGLVDGGETNRADRFALGRLPPRWPGSSAPARARRPVTGSASRDTWAGPAPRMNSVSARLARASTGPAWTPASIWVTPTWLCST